MKLTLLSLLTSAALAAGCATVVPPELSDARASFHRASAGPASRVAPVELHAAETALALAEKSFEDSPSSFHTRDLSYVAQRKAELAEASASIAIEQEAQKASDAQFLATQGAMVAKSKADLSEANADLSSTRTALNASEKSAAAVAEQLAAEQKARAAADQRAATAQAALAKLAAVKDEPRGLVITLSGSVLFASNSAALLPSARARLGQVADVLLSSRERHVVVEGHTDAQGSDAHNMDLSQRRADAVREFLVGQNYEADLVTAKGMGETQPVASNDTAEGRANNRRVEIIIPRDVITANP